MTHKPFTFLHFTTPEELDQMSIKFNKKGEVGFEIIVGIIAVVLIVSAVPFLIGSLNSAGTLLPGAESNVESASYIIFKDDFNGICAKNGQTGRIDFRSSTDLGLIVNNVMDVLSQNGTGGGSILIKPGSYDLVTTIEIPDSLGIHGKFSLLGSGWSTQIFQKTPNIRVINLSGYSDILNTTVYSKDVQIKDMLIDVGGATLNTIPINGSIRIHRAQHGTFENIRIENSYGTAFLLSRSYWCQLTDIYVYHGYGTGIRIGQNPGLMYPGATFPNDGSYSDALTNCHIEGLLNLTGWSRSIGIDLNSTQGTVLKQCDTSGEYIGLMMEGWNNMTNVISNYFEGTYIGVQMSYKSTNTYFVNPSFYYGAIRFNVNGSEGLMIESPEYVSRGVATVEAGNNSCHVHHGLVGIPNMILLTGSNWSSSQPIAIYPTSSVFHIYLHSDGSPADDDELVYWEARVIPV